MGERVGPDFFISYTSHDVAWAEWIAWQLESVGWRVVVQAWDFRPGLDFVHEMDRAVRDADRLIIVLSPAYGQSEFAEAEWRPFFTRDRSGERGTIVQVRVGDIAPSGVLELRVYIDLLDITDAAVARETLLKGIQPPSQSIAGAGQPIGYSGTVDTTVQLAVEQLHDAAARALLTWCAFMAADSIPLDLLTAPRALDLLPVEMRRLAEDEIDMDDAIAVLYGSSLLARRDAYWKCIDSSKPCCERISRSPITGRGPS